MDISSTKDLMVSKNYKERFIAEYWQLRNRYESLHNMLIKIKAGTLQFEPNSSKSVLRTQEYAMHEYLVCLEVRAEQENIDLNMPVTLLR